MAKLKIKELSHKDILKLSEKDLKNMINFRMAEEGLKIMLPPVEPELVQIPEEDVTLYSFQGLNLSFTTIQEAEKVRDLILTLSPVKTDYDYGYGSKTYISKDLTEFGTSVLDITSRKAYSYKLYQQVKEDLSENSKRSDAYKRVKNEYDQSVEDAKYVREEIYGYYHEIVEKYDSHESMLNRYKEYIEIAGGDKDVAMSFLKKAYVITSEDEVYISNNLTQKDSKRIYNDEMEVSENEA